MEEDEWMYESIMMSEEINLNEDIGEELNELATVQKTNYVVDCSDAFNTCEVFPTRDDVLHWARAIAYDIGFCDCNNEI